MMIFLKTIINFLRPYWEILLDVLSILNKSRFSFIIVALTVLSLEYVGQIKDILVGLSHPERKMQVVYFVLSINWLAFQAWGWARYIYTLCYPVDEDGKRGEEGYQRFLIDWLPRIYAMVAFLAAYRAASRAQVDGVAWGIIVVAVLVLLFLIYRRELTKKLSQRVTRRVKLTENSHHYFTAIVMVITSVYAIASPVGFGNWLGAGAVVFLGLGSIIPVGTLLVSAARENSFPVVGSLILLAVVFSGFNDNHHVRDIPGEKANTQQYSLNDSLKAWQDQADADKPMVLLATAGGGLRASYWTGVILGRFQDLIPDFNRQVFAISGVSGGSVGAVFYNAALAHDTDCLPTDNQQPCFENNLLNAIGRDYLAPTAASLLYGDLLQRFLPFSLFSDRAAALEESWEQGFAAVYPKATCGLEKSFTDFYFTGACNRLHRWLPRLLINGTYEETGKRLLTTSFKVDPGVFLDTHDFYALNDQVAIRASTAALNSARFSYVSPAGTFGDDVGHVIDGGYFENYGATTLANLIGWLKINDAQFGKRGLIVIAISNDSSIPLLQYEVDAIPATAKPQKFLNEVLAPVLGLVNTRAGHGMLAYKQLAQDADRDELGSIAELLHFYLEPNEGQSPPLGWILSEQAKQNMRNQITGEHNCSAYNRILKSLSSKGTKC